MAKFEIGLRCGYFLSMAPSADGREVKRDFFLGVNGGKIAEISAWHESKKSDCSKFIDASKKAVMPGLVNAHTHLPMTLFRGLEDDVPFHKWLFERILPLENKMVSEDFVRVGTELAMLESIRFGVTTVSDMYFFAETIADVVDQAGIRGWISQAFTDGPTPEDSVLGRDKEKLFRSLHSRYRSHDRIVAALGPHAPYTCGDETLKTVSRLATELSAPIHTHVSETKFEVEESIKKFGMSPVKRLEGLGILRKGSMAAHCVHFSDEDIEIFLKSGASVIYNPDSNMKLSSGTAPIYRYRKAGIQVALGTDGAASNNDLSIFGVMDLGTKLQKLIAHDNTAMTASDALTCATIEGASALGLDKKTGSLELGKAADLIIVGLEWPHLKPLHDLKSHLVYSLQGMEVETVLCAGKVVMENGEVKTIDEAKVFARAEEWRERVAREVSRL